MKSLKPALLLAALFTANAMALDASSLKLQVYSVMLSTSPQCTSPVTVFSSATATEVDFLASPTLGSGNPPDATYNCVIIKMSDLIKFTPASTVRPVHGRQAVHGRCLPHRQRRHHTGARWHRRAERLQRHRRRAGLGHRVSLPDDQSVGRHQRQHLHAADRPGQRQRAEPDGAARDRRHGEIEIHRQRHRQGRRRWRQLRHEPAGVRLPEVAVGRSCPAGGPGCRRHGVNRPRAASGYWWTSTQRPGAHLASARRRGVAAVIACGSRTTATSASSPLSNKVLPTARRATGRLMWRCRSRA